MSRNEEENIKNQVMGASQSELLIMTYQLLINSIESMMDNIDIKDIDNFYVEHRKSIQILNELKYTLNMNYSISIDLFNLYGYITQLLNESALKLEREKLEESLKLLRILLEGWDRIKDYKEPLVNNHSKIISGMTYGKNGLNDSVIYGKDGIKA